MDHGPFRGLKKKEEKKIAFNGYTIKSITKLPVYTHTHAHALRDVPTLTHTQRNTHRYTHTHSVQHRLVITGTVICLLVTVL